MSFKSWTEKNQGAWEFIKFMVLSNISTITRIVLTAVGTAIFVDALRMTEPFQFLIFDYRDTGVGAFVTFLIAEVMAQVVNFFVQMKWVFKSDASFRDTAWKYAVLAVLIVLPLDPLSMKVSVLLTAMPAANTTAMLAGKYGRDPVFASELIMTSTLLSLFTIPLVSGLLSLV